MNSTELEIAIKEMIKEHKEAGYCTNYDMAQNELEKDAQNAFDYAYDCGRYETLEKILNLIVQEKPVVLLIDRTHNEDTQAFSKEKFLEYAMNFIVEHTANYQVEIVNVKE